MDLRILSLNCNGLKSSIPVLGAVLDTCDILCLQEIMITKQECDILNTLHDDFYGVAFSPVDATLGVISGRPFGGVGIMWRKSVDIAVTVIDLQCDWLCGVKISSNDKIFILLNVYLPYQCDLNRDKFNDYLAKLYVHIAEMSSTCVTNLGGNMARNTQFPIMITRSTIIYDITSPGAAGSSIYV